LCITSASKKGQRRRSKRNYFFMGLLKENRGSRSKSGKAGKINGPGARIEGKRTSGRKTDQAGRGRGDTRQESLAKKKKKFGWERDRNAKTWGGWWYHRGGSQEKERVTRAGEKGSRNQSERRTLKVPCQLRKKKNSKDGGGYDPDRP